MSHNICKFVLLSFVVVRNSKEEVLTTVQGQIRGIRHDGFVSYSGIPYANISADGRFKRAGLAPSWTGIRESRPLSSNCLYQSVEECLKLDVHVPNGVPATPWPVLVWVPSGCGQYHPGMFAKEGIIVVNVNYRNGPLGFLCLNHEKVPGNAGAKDLILALRWVQDNIVAFRGSPSKVIIAGQSYGAAMIEALMVSPNSEGLFHGVILQSGSILSPWAFNVDASYRAKELAHALTDSDDLDEMVSAVLTAQVHELAEKSRILDLPYFPFGMCVEKQLLDGGILHESPINLLANSKVIRVPIIMGYNTDEAYIFAMNLKTNNIVRKIKGDITFLLPQELVFFDGDEAKKVGKQVKDMYFSNNISMSALLPYHRDAYFIQNIYRSARLHLQANGLPIYLYQFAHASNLGVEPVQGVKKSGAAHSDELAYLFPDKGRVLEGEDGVVQERLVKLWTNFVKYLNPTPSGDPVQWNPLNIGQLRVLNIDKDLEMREFPFTRAMQLWEDIYDRYYYRRFKNFEL